MPNHLRPHGTCIQVPHTKCIVPRAVTRRRLSGRLLQHVLVLNPYDFQTLETVWRLDGATTFAGNQIEHRRSGLVLGLRQ